ADNGAANVGLDSVGKLCKGHGSLSMMIQQRSVTLICMPVNCVRVNGCISNLGPERRHLWRQGKGQQGCWRQGKGQQGCWRSQVGASPNWNAPRVNCVRVNCVRVNLRMVKG